MINHFTDCGLERLRRVGDKMDILSGVGGSSLGERDYQKILKRLEESEEIKMVVYEGSFEGEGFIQHDISDRENGLIHCNIVYFPQRGRGVATGALNVTLVNMLDGLDFKYN